MEVQVVATDVNADNLASLVNEAPDIRAEVMDVKKYEDVEIVIPGVQPCGHVYACHVHVNTEWCNRHADPGTWTDLACELQIARSEGGLHVLSNNAGVFPLGPIELLAEEVWLISLFGSLQRQLLCRLM
jgi:NAD(P)-dependent dehydrogenase (short-subunit alcohol dehydrogenase family)